eukprot:101021-Amorphochlora_amoeboformis.AAC.1
MAVGDGNSSMRAKKEFYRELRCNSTSGPVRLNPQKYIPVKLIKKEVVSENCDRPTVFLTFDTNVE